MFRKPYRKLKASNCLIFYKQIHRLFWIHYDQIHILFWIHYGYGLQVEINIIFDKQNPTTLLNTQHYHQRPLYFFLSSRCIPWFFPQKCHNFENIFSIFFWTLRLPQSLSKNSTPPPKKKIFDLFFLWGGLIIKIMSFDLKTITKYGWESEKIKLWKVQSLKFKNKEKNESFKKQI